jgi:hypothetical protein
VGAIFIPSQALRNGAKLSIIAKCHTNQRNVIHGPDKEREGQASSFKFPALMSAQIVKLRHIHIPYVKNAAFMTANKF